MVQAKSGDTVRVHYTGKYDDGTVFDTSTGNEPLQFTIGEGEIIKGFEQAIVGMDVGELKSTTIVAGEAYGSYHQELIVVVDRGELPSYLNLEVGQRLQLTPEEGRMIVMTVTEITEASVTLDGNHPLAGKDLTFDIELVEVL
ncbi:MAG: peptidylprolyl isomerase [Deltaproteobacteria bacterium]|nr:peptidylprolyl isomerase [Deltaproteobacteria bacterium]